MPLHFDDPPSVIPGKPFVPYSFKSLRNEILFRLLARHGTIVASSLEFNAEQPATLQVASESICTHGGLTIKVNAPTRRRFYQAPYLHNPYHRPSDGICVTPIGWKSVQPLILGDNAKDAQATLQLEHERMHQGPFTLDSFENDIEPLKQPTLRYFVKRAQLRGELLRLIPAGELVAVAPSVDTQNKLANLCTPQMIDDLWKVKLTHQAVERTVLGHLNAFHANPAAYPAWRDYATSEAREKHHLYKSFQRLDAHYSALENHVKTTTDKNRRPLTEARGEYLAAKVMAMVFASELFELKMGFGDKKGAQGIDQIWAKRHPTTKEIEAYFIIEAKGSKSAKHGQNKEETQMSPGWVFKKLLEQASSPTEGERVRSLAKKVLCAMFNEDSLVAVYGMTLKAIYDAKDKTSTASQFNLQISQALNFPKLLKHANDTSLTIDSVQELFGASPFQATNASQMDIASRVPFPAVKMHLSEEVSLDVRGKNPKFDNMSMFAPEHPRNGQLLKLLAAHATSILSVHDYFGVDPRTAIIGPDGKLKYFTGFASTIYGKNGHEHLKLVNLVDPSDKDPNHPVVLLESMNRDKVAAVFAWKKGNMQVAPAPATSWKSVVTQLGGTQAVQNILMYFGTHSSAREKLKEIMNTPAIADKSQALQLAFPLADPVSLEGEVTLKGKKMPLWQHVLTLKEDTRFAHHQAKSFQRLGQHYGNLEDQIHKSLPDNDSAVTETLGEFLGARAMAIIFGKDKLQLKMGHGEKNGSHGIDQIWVKRDQPTGKVLTYFLVECKGSKKAELGQNRAETQMSAAWICKKLFELAQDSTSLRLPSLARKILQAMFEPKSTISVYGVIIQSLYGGEEPKGRFNIRITSRLFFPDILDWANQVYASLGKGAEFKVFDPHQTIRHNQMPFTTFLPDYKATQAPPRGPPVLLCQPNPKQQLHLAHKDYPLSSEQITKLEEKSFTTVHQAGTGTGDSAYNTVIYVLKQLEEWRREQGLANVPSVEDLKKWVVEFIDAHPEVAKRFLEPGENADGLKNRVRQRFTVFGSGGDIVLPALAKKLQLRIHVIYPNGTMEDLNKSLNLGIPSKAPALCAVLTTYLGDPTGVIRYYPAYRKAPPAAPPPAAAPVATPMDVVKQASQKRKPDDPGSNPKKSKPMPKPRPGPKPPGEPPKKEGPGGGPKKGGPGGDPSGMKARL